MTYVIAEIGQNHNGSVDLAKELIHMAANPTPYSDPTAEPIPVDAVKLTARYLPEECTSALCDRPYESIHSYGATYGEHRHALELTPSEHAECYAYAKQHGLDFVETVCHPWALKLILDEFEPDALKVASRDLSNEPLLDAVASAGLPVILSTGMADVEDIDAALEIIGDKCAVTVLHCLSAYPASFRSLNLARIAEIRRLWPACRAGYSDHSQGIVAPVVAVALGAQVIEKHITLDRSAKGSDHSGSLERDGLWRMMRDIRHAEQAIGQPSIYCHPDALPAKQKLERHLCASKDVSGRGVDEHDLLLLSSGTADGIVWRDRHKILGREPRVPIRQGEVFRLDQFG